MQVDQLPVTADPTDREVKHAREVVDGRGGQSLAEPHGVTPHRFPVPGAREAVEVAKRAAQPVPFRLTPDVTIQGQGCHRHHRIAVPMDDEGDEPPAILCITCDGLAATPDFGHFPRFES